MAIQIGVAALVVIAIFLIFVATRPSQFKYSRTAVIPVSPDKVFPLLNDFHEWEHWSPWAKIDPNAENSFDGPTSGVGSKFAWDGNNKVGAGRMEIIKSRPNELINIDLVFLKPMQANNLAEFQFQPEGTGTRVTWTMSGSIGCMGKLFNLFMNCEKMVGGQFEQGLENMKRLATSRG